MSAAASATSIQNQQADGHYFLWDASRVDCVIGDAMFEPQAWRDAGRLSGEASGRGAAWFLHPQQGDAWVLRHSRRGGLVARISTDRYCWLGLNRCRVMQEFRLLAELRKRSLPVPAPVAARVVRQGCIYSGDLITVQVENARPLADWLMDKALDAAVWRDIGAIIARFHSAGVYHHDLNARNILIDEDHNVTLIDLDKSAIRKPGRWQQKNLARLRRSLEKFAYGQQAFNFSVSDWDEMTEGYNAAHEIMSTS